VITTEQHAGRFDLETLIINDAFINNLLQGQNAISILELNDPAVAVYTSGSTGVPKTILIQQKALANAIAGFGPGMDFGLKTRTLQNAAFAFDIHAYEIFMTLANGGCLVISDTDQSELARTIRAKETNWLFMTPSTMFLLSGPEDILSVKTSMMIGEAPTRDIIEK
jgi:non-ribosomal peptide synthetase component F